MKDTVVTVERYLPGKRARGQFAGLVVAGTMMSGVLLPDTPVGAPIEIVLHRLAALPPFSLALLASFFAILAALAAVRVARSWGNETSRSDPWPLLLLYLTLIYLGLHLTTAWVSGGTYAGRQGTLNTLYLAVGLGFAFLAGSAQQAIGLLAMMTVTQSVLTLWLALHSENGIWSGTVYRAGGTFGHPTTLYIVLAPCLPLIAALPAERPAAARVARGLATLLMLTALLLTWYRAALVAAAVVQVFLTARLSRDHTGRMRRIAVIGTGMALLVLLAGYVRMTGEANSISSGYSIDGRQRLWRAGWQTFCEHPLTGVGLNHLAIPLTMERYGRTEYCVARQPMNVPLLLVAELGIGGGLLFTLTVITIARTLPGRDRVSLGVQGAWLTFAIMGLFDAPFGTEGREAGTVLLGALLGITLLCRPPFPLQTASCETGEPEVLR